MNAQHFFVALSILFMPLKTDASPLPDEDSTPLFQNDQDSTEPTMDGAHDPPTKTFWITIGAAAAIALLAMILIIVIIARRGRNCLHSGVREDVDVSIDGPSGRYQGTSLCLATSSAHGSLPQCYREGGIITPFWSPCHNQTENTNTSSPSTAIRRDSYSSSLKPGTPGSDRKQLQLTLYGYTSFLPTMLSPDADPMSAPTLTRLVLPDAGSRAGSRVAYSVDSPPVTISPCAASCASVQTHTTFLQSPSTTNSPSDGPDGICPPPVVISNNIRERCSLIFNDGWALYPSIPRTPPPSYSPSARLSSYPSLPMAAKHTSLTT